MTPDQVRQVTPNQLSGIDLVITSYGTLLLWPFSAARVSRDAIAIVDPLFTFVLAAGLALAHIRRSALPVFSERAMRRTLRTTRPGTTVGRLG